VIFVVAKILQEKDGSEIVANSPKKEAILKDTQMTFFGAAPAVKEKVPEHLTQLEAALRTLDINRCSPFDALQTLKSWKDGLPGAPPPC
jgi:hypothetical protein